MRRAVFGEPLLAHPPKIGWIDAPGSARFVDEQHATDCDEKCDSEQHGLEAPGPRAVIARSSQIRPLLSVRLCTAAPVPRRPRD
jgi:hypothetical protein